MKSVVWFSPKEELPTDVRDDPFTLWSSVRRPRRTFLSVVLLLAYLPQRNASVSPQEIISLIIRPVIPGEGWTRAGVRLLGAMFRGAAIQSVNLGTPTGLRSLFFIDPLAEWVLPRCPHALLNLWGCYPVGMWPRSSDG